MLIDSLLVGGLALLLAVMLLADRTLFLSRCGLAKSPEALQEIAERMLAQLGYRVEPAFTGVTLDPDCLQFIRSHPELPQPWQQVRTGEIPAVFFWYRQGDPRLPRPAPLGEPAWERLAQPLPGTATIRLDGRGMLLSVQVAGSAADDSPRREPVNWQALFAAAGLELADFRDVPTGRSPPLFADEVRNWEGPFPTDPRLSLTISGAALHGHVVFFDVDQPWERSRNSDGMFGGQKSRFVSVKTALWLIAIGVATALAWHNVRRGHADWTGMRRVVSCVMVLAASHWLLGSRHTLVLAEELAVGYLWLNVIAFTGVLAGVAYLAVEPAARRWWPWSIITTQRLLAGRLRDRSIGRDLLLGIVVGLASVVLRQLSTLVTSLFELPVSGLNDFDLGQDLVEFLGLRYRAAVLLTSLLLAVTAGLLLLSLVIALKRLTRSTLAAALCVIVLLTGLEIAGRGIVSPVDWVARALLWVVTISLLMRHGLLATSTGLATFYALNNTPVTLNYAAWFAPTSFFVVGTIAIGLPASWYLAKSGSSAATNRSSGAHLGVKRRL